VTTVRDFGPDHINKWKSKHWLIGFYDIKGKNLQYSHYGSPDQMAPWIESKRKYVQPDFDLANLASRKFSLDLEDLYEIVEKKDIYTLKDAQSIQKRQYKVEKYQELMDEEGGFTPQRMLEILIDRSRYLFKRGATLNNPKIPKTYFNGWYKIENNHKLTLNKMVREAIKANK
jgi:hypothetical protein